MATKKAIQKKNDTVKMSAKKITNNAIQVTDNLVEGSLATGAKWQKIMAKALTEGTTLFGKQQDLALDTLEGIKGQVLYTNKRFQKLFGFGVGDITKAVSKKMTTIEKKVGKVMDEVADKKVKPVVNAIKEATTIEKTTKRKATKKAKTVAKAVKKAAKAEVVITKDKLKAIDGIGPKIESLLNKAGFSTFDQIAKADFKDLQAVLDEAGSRFNMHDPKTWKVQARRLAKKK